MMIVHIKRNETTWETFTAGSAEEALHKSENSIRRRRPVPKGALMGA